MRKLRFPAPQLTYITINVIHSSKFILIDKWIKITLNSRYYIGQGITLDKTNTIVYNTLIGFENETEISFFKIACPHIP